MAEAERVEAVAAQLRRDADVERLFAILEDAGVEAILLKGAAFARFLYSPEESRPSVDIDLLVSAEDVPAALAALRTAGFSPQAMHPGAVLRERHATEMARNGCIVDLHHTIVGVGAPDEDVWRSFLACAERMPLHTRDVRIPSQACLALHATLHASWSDHDEVRPREDARRAAQRFDLETWKAADSLAESLDARPGFVVGLRASAEGRRILQSLGVSARLPLRHELLMQLPPTIALRLLRCSRMRPLEGLSFLREELAPPTLRLREAAADDLSAASRTVLLRRRLGYATSRMPSAISDTVCGVWRARRQFRGR